MVSMIRNFLFDLGGVLIDLDTKRSLSILSGLLVDTKSFNIPITADDLLGGGTTEAMKAYQVGDISTDDFLQTILHFCRPETTRSQIIDAWYAMLLSLPKHRIDMLVRLKKAGYRIFILSNINELHVWWVLDYFQKQGITYPNNRDKQFTSPDTLLDGLYFSNEIHAAKPSERAYRIFFETSGVVPEETFYIDDLKQNIETGERVGLQTLLATGDEWMPAAEKFLV